LPSDPKIITSIWSSTGDNYGLSINSSNNATLIPAHAFSLFNTAVIENDDGVSIARFIPSIILGEISQNNL
jgi:hypothetical protein